MNSGDHLGHIGIVGPRGPRRGGAAGWPSAVAAAFGFAWFLELGGRATLNPFNVSWLLQGDLAQHWLGFLFFQREPWTLPIGSISGLLYPLGTNVGYTDSNPLVSMALKPLAGWLPAEYQTLGLWLAACFVLQGYMGARLVRVVTDNPTAQALAGMLFVMSPVLALRTGHDTLCAHWLLLAIFYIAFRDRTIDGAAWRAPLAVGAIIACAAATHPYLGAMCWLIGLAIHVRLWLAHRLNAMRAAAVAAATTAVMFAIFATIGYFDGVKLEDGGFGLFSADLLALANPESFSRLLPAQPTHPGQYEGFGFLGLGGLLAVIAGIGLVAARRPRLPTGAWPVIAAAVAMAVFALSSVITWQGREVLRLVWLYQPFEWLTGAFRSSGRFIWPLHYLALLFGVWGITRIAGSRRAFAGTVLLAAVVLMQGLDFKAHDLTRAPATFSEPPAFVIERFAGRFRHLALYPMQVRGCGPLNQARVYHYMWMALRLRTTVNSGVLARLPEAAAREECARLDRSVTEGTLDPTTLFVLMSEPHLERFQRAGAVCKRLTGDWFCVSKDSDPAIRDLLVRQ